MFMVISRVLACFNIGYAKDEQGRQIDFEVKPTPGLISRPEPFPHSIEPRSEKHAAMIRESESEFPWEAGSSGLLEVRVGELVAQPREF